MPSVFTRFVSYTGRIELVVHTCGSDTVVKHGRDETRSERQRYHCRNCNRYFDDLTGTIFEGHHESLNVWILCLYFMGLNLSNSRIAYELDPDTSDVQQMTE